MTFRGINFKTNPLSWTPFFTSRPNSQNSNAQWQDFSLHCLLLFQICHVIRLTGFRCWIAWVYHAGLPHRLCNIVNPSFRYHLSSWFLREKVYCVPNKKALMDSGLNLAIRCYYFSQSEALKPRLIVFASKRQKSVESISPNTSPTPICQPISCLISTFISCWFYKPRLWSVSNIFGYVMVHNLWKYILG